MNIAQDLTNIVAYAVQVGLVVGIGAALPVLLRLKAPGTRLRYWQLLLLACLALPWMRPWQSEVIAVSYVPIAVSTFAAPVAVAAPVRFAMPPVSEIAIWLLLAGVAIRLIWLAVGLSKLARYRRHGHAIPLPAEWRGAAGHASLLISDEISGPVTFGFFRPVVLLPASFPAMPAAMRDAILFHELLHVERRDWLLTFGEELLRAVFWFHPAIWWVLGEIQLAREQTVDQAVIEMTQARDPYVDTLLAMAGVSAHLDLVPAPLFLRRRHLKQRVMGIVQEAGVEKAKISKMWKLRLALSQVAALGTMAVACWVITGAIPLHAQAQMVADAPGVTVNLNGTQLLHRSPVTYPGDALAKGIEGTVVVQVRLDANGEVIDDAILSGPDELRKSVQQTVLNWHFDKNAGSATRVVNIEFLKPANSGANVISPGSAVTTGVLMGIPASPMPSAIPATPSPEPSPALTDQLFALEKQQSQLQEQQSAAGATPEQRAQMAQALARLQELSKRVQELRTNAAQAAPRATIDGIVVRGLSDSATAELKAQLPVHAGDTYTSQSLTQVAEAARQFDEHLMVSTQVNVAGAYTIRVETPEARAMVTTLPLPAPPGAAKVGGNVMAANLINPVKPIYPPLAKMARQQGTVKFQATVGKDGTIEDLQVISGPPLLIQAALTAVKQWTYRPTILNGAPVEVVTTIDVNFALAEGPPPAFLPAQ